MNSTADRQATEKITAVLPSPLAQDLRIRAVLARTTISDLVRQALESHFANNPVQEEQQDEN